MEWKYKDIDHTKLNERIVEQAWRGTLPSVLDEEDVQRLVAEKMRRARQERDQLVKQGYFSDR